MEHNNTTTKPRAKRMAGTTFRDSKGVYNFKGESFISVTTALKIKDKPALPRWASKSVAEYVKLICEKRNAGEITGTELMEQLLDTDRLKNIPWTFAEKKRDMGSTFHGVAEQLSLGVPVSADVFSEDVRPYIKTFIDWMEKSGVEYEATECAIYNRTHNYAGTCDAIIKLNGRTLIADYKTSADSYEEHCLQLAAYRFGEFIGLETGEELPVPQTDGGIILIVGPDKVKALEWPCDEAAFDAFIALRNACRWSELRVKYKELPVWAGLEVSA